MVHVSPDICYLTFSFQPAITSFESPCILRSSLKPSPLFFKPPSYDDGKHYESQSLEVFVNNITFNMAFNFPLHDAVGDWKCHPITISSTIKFRSHGIWSCPLNVFSHSTSLFFHSKNRKPTVFTHKACSKFPLQPTIFWQKTIWAINPSGWRRGELFLIAILIFFSFYFYHLQDEHKTTKKTKRKWKLGRESWLLWLWIFKRKILKIFIK